MGEGITQNNQDRTGVTPTQGVFSVVPRFVVVRDGHNVSHTKVHRACIIMDTNAIIRSQIVFSKMRRIVVMKYGHKTIFTLRPASSLEHAHTIIYSRKQKPSSDLEPRYDGSRGISPLSSAVDNNKIDTVVVRDAASEMNKFPQVSGVQEQQPLSSRSREDFRSTKDTSGLLQPIVWRPNHSHMRFKNSVWKLAPFVQGRIDHEDFRVAFLGQKFPQPPRWEHRCFHTSYRSYWSLCTNGFCTSI